MRAENWGLQIDTARQFTDTLHIQFNRNNDISCTSTWAEPDARNVFSSLFFDKSLQQVPLQSALSFVIQLLGEVEKFFCNDSAFNLSVDVCGVVFDFAVYLCQRARLHLGALFEKDDAPFLRGVLLLFFKF